MRKTQRVTTLLLSPDADLATRATFVQRAGLHTSRNVQ